VLTLHVPLLGIMQTKFWELALSNPLLQAHLARLLSQVLPTFPALAASLVKLSAVDADAATALLRHARSVLSSDTAMEPKDALSGGCTGQKRRHSLISEDQHPRKTMKQVHRPCSSFTASCKCFFTLLDVRAKVKASEWSSFHKTLVHEPVTWKSISIDAVLVAILVKKHNLYLDQVARRYKRGNRRSGPLPEPWLPYPATIVTAKIVDMQLPPPSRETSTLFGCLQFLDFFKGLEGIFISNISQFDACANFLQYRFGRTLSRFKHVHVAPFTPMASFGIVDPASTYALSASLMYTPQIDVSVTMEKNMSRRLCSSHAGTSVPYTDTITIAEVKFLTELQTAYKHGEKFQVLNSEISYQAIEVNDLYEEEESNELFRHPLPALRSRLYTQ